MYKKSKDLSLHKLFARNTREGTCIVFRTANYEGVLYKRSPYFVNSRLWSSMPVADNELLIMNCLMFLHLKRDEKGLSRTYVNLLL